MPPLLTSIRQSSEIFCLICISAAARSGWNTVHSQVSTPSQQTDASANWDELGSLKISLNRGELICRGRPTIQWGLSAAWHWENSTFRLKASFSLWSASFLLTPSMQSYKYEPHIPQPFLKKRWKRTLFFFFFSFLSGSEGNAIRLHLFVKCCDHEGHRATPPHPPTQITSHKSDSCLWYMKLYV